jgi:hypothetical protein
MMEKAPQLTTRTIYNIIRTIKVNWDGDEARVVLGEGKGGGEEI